MNKYSSYILYLLISIFVVTLYVNDFGPLSSLQQSVNDGLAGLTAEESAPSNIVIVSVDGRAQDEYGNWPWNRDLIADLLAAAGSGDPKCLVANFDMVDNAAQDAAGHTQVLADQISWIKNIVLPYDISLATFRSGKTRNPDHLFEQSLAIDNPLGIMEEQSSLLTRKVYLPSEKILKHEPHLGFDYIMPDRDRILRKQPMIMNYDGYYYPSASLLASAVYLGVPADQIRVTEGVSIDVGAVRTIPINAIGEHTLNFRPNNQFVRYSAADLLAEGFDFGRLKGKLVLIGIDDFDNTEMFLDPSGAEIPRLLVQATVIDNIVNDNLIRLLNEQPGIDMLILFLLGGMFAFILPQVSVMYRMVILFGGFILLANLNYVLFSQFRMAPQTVFIALELLIFMIASPFLDTALLGGEAKATKKKTGLPKVKVGSPKMDNAIIEPSKTRELIENANDADNIETAAVTTAAPQVANLHEDHQAINIDDDTIAEEDKTGAVTDIAPILQEDNPPEPEITSPGPTIITPSETDTSAYGQHDDADLEDSDVTPISGGIQPSDITQMGRYKITGILGKGAMGQVYKGIDPAINRPVALKTIRLDFVNDPEEMAELKERLHREAQAAGKLSHPNIVTIYDVGSEGHLAYIAMEYLEGQTLEEMIKKKTKFNYRIIANIIVQICSALDYAHSHGIIHRDIKPANIMILKDFSVKVMDYGIARVDSSSMTKTGIAMGTPNYISPEQLKGTEVDHRADLFSLGVVMYELLIGKRPFKGENITSLIYSVLNNEPMKPSNIKPAIPLLFDHIVERALRKEPKDRYQKASEITADLADFVESFAPTR